MTFANTRSFFYRNPFSYATTCLFQEYCSALRSTIRAQDSPLLAILNVTSSSTSSSISKLCGLEITGKKPRFLGENQSLAE